MGAAGAVVWLLLTIIGLSGVALLAGARDRVDAARAHALARPLPVKRAQVPTGPTVRSCDCESCTIASLHALLELLPAVERKRRGRI